MMASTLKLTLSTDCVFTRSNRYLKDVMVFLLNSKGLLDRYVELAVLHHLDVFPALVNLPLENGLLSLDIHIRPALLYLHSLGSRWQMRHGRINRNEARVIRQSRRHASVQLA